MPSAQGFTKAIPGAKMDIDLKMRNQVVESLCKKLKLPFKDDYSNKQLSDMIFLVTGWDTPHYGKRADYVQMYWRRYITSNSRPRP